MSDGERKRFYKVGKSLVERGRGHVGNPFIKVKSANPKAHPVDIYVSRDD